MVYLSTPSLQLLRPVPGFQTVQAVSVVLLQHVIAHISHCQSDNGFPNNYILSTPIMACRPQTGANRLHNGHMAYYDFGTALNCPLRYTFYS